MYAPRGATWYRHPSATALNPLRCDRAMPPGKLRVIVGEKAVAQQAFQIVDMREMIHIAMRVLSRYRHLKILTTAVGSDGHKKSGTSTYRIA
jgi:hypothetical protein